MPFFPNFALCSKKISSKYKLYVCGNFFLQALILEKIAIPGQPPGGRDLREPQACERLTI